VTEAGASRGLRTDGDRLWRSLMRMAEIGATPEGGSQRLALTDEDNAALELFEGWARAEGCRVTRDRVGNSFAERPGIDAARAPVLVGSHLDTQPRGGRFDGPLGTLAALEIMRTLNEHDVRTIAPVIAVSWTNEEGARFPLPCTGSSVFARVLDFEQAMNQHAYDGPTFADELGRLGRAGTDDMDRREFAAYFELHIEQGPVLESTDKVIGVVSRGQGVRGIAVTFTGRDAHAGTTPMEGRHDALVGAARLVTAVRELALRTRGALGTVSRLEVRPGSRAVIPSRAELIVDIRHRGLNNLDTLEAELRREIAAIAEAAGLDAKVETFLSIPPVVFHHSCVAAIKRATARLGYPAMEIVSGAAHDAFAISSRMPTAMVFIPCRNGVSHHPAEYAEPDRVRAGSDVLLHAVLYKAGVAERAGY
jgi:N-carbamoyl-L-amino-acid hydrolase